MSGPTQASDFTGITAFRLTWCPRTRILTLRDQANHPTIGSRILGFVGLIAVAWLSQWYASKHGWSAGGVCFAAVYAFGCVFALGSVNNLTLDFSNGTYLRCTGLWPFLWRSRGRLDEIQAIQVRTESRTHFSKVAGMCSYQVRVVSLDINEATTKPLLLAAGRMGGVVRSVCHLAHDASVVESDAQTLGQLTGIPVVLSPTES